MNFSKITHFALRILGNTLTFLFFIQAIPLFFTFKLYVFLYTKTKYVRFYLRSLFRMVLNLLNLLKKCLIVLQG